MKNYVVGILSLFENNLEQFKVTAENEYEAVKIGMVEFCEDEESKKFEKEFQESEHYPKDYNGLWDAYEEIFFNVIKV
jgi:hypothetical protein